jgi:hypothetical protein
MIVLRTNNSSIITDRIAEANVGNFGARGAREKSDFFAKRSGAAMYPTCFRLED